MRKRLQRIYLQFKKQCLEDIFIQRAGKRQSKYFMIEYCLIIWPMLRRFQKFPCLQQGVDMI